MKKGLFIIAAVVVGIGFTACSVDTSGLDELEDKLEEASEKLDEEMENAEATAEDEAEAVSTVMYQCPDNCENGPAYFDAGACKSCGKEMVEI